MLGLCLHALPGGADVWWPSLPCAIFAVLEAVALPSNYGIARVIGEFFLRQPVASCIMMRSLLFACWLAKLMARACCNCVFVE